MTILLDLQLVVDESEINHKLPSSSDFSSWLTAGIDSVRELQDSATEQEHSDNDALEPLEVTLRICGVDESQELNQTYRNKNKPTNVLSFPFEPPEHVQLPFLGDLIICAPVVEREAIEQNKAVTDHWAHLSLHGLLHLLGYDHIEDDEANEMEALEICILAKLGIDDPYQDQ